MIHCMIDSVKNYSNLDLGVSQAFHSTHDRGEKGNTGIFVEEGQLVLGLEDELLSLAATNGSFSITHLKERKG